MFKNIAKKAMTTTGQRIGLVVDHLVEALGNEPSSSLRRALILADIDHNPGTTQTGVMERLQIHKSAMNREIDWLFNYGCIMRREGKEDGRTLELEVCGYSKRALDSALDYFDGSHENLKIFLNEMGKALEQEKPTLRDAKIAAFLFEHKDASKQEVMEHLHEGAASTNNRAYTKLVNDGVIQDG